MCVTNTVNRRATVTVSAAALASSPSIVSQRLWKSIPESTERAVETNVKSSTVAPGTVPSSAVPSVPASGYGFLTQPRGVSDSESSFPEPEAAKAPKRRRKRKRKPQMPGKTAKMNDRHFVVHNYHDHALDQDVPEPPAADGSKPRRRGGVAIAFPLKLHAMLDKIEEDGLAHVVSWQPHGRAFVVHKPKQFVDEVMPKYFRQTRLTSFQRQLNLYGFNRVTKGIDNGGYYHELFLRGKVFLSKRMTRTKVKGTGFKAASSPDSEPDFYAMPFVKHDPPAYEIMDREGSPEGTNPPPASVQSQFSMNSGDTTNLTSNVVSSSGSEGTMDSSDFLGDSMTEMLTEHSVHQENRDDLMLDFLQMWDPEVGTPVPPRISDGYTGSEPFSYPFGRTGEVIENDTQLGELLESLLAD